jgi:hypothetical protein
LIPKKYKLLLGVLHVLGMFGVILSFLLMLVFASVGLMFIILFSYPVSASALVRFNQTISPYFLVLAHSPIPQLMLVLWLCSFMWVYAHVFGSSFTELVIATIQNFNRWKARRTRVKTT